MDVFLAARLLRPVGIRDVDYRPEELDHPATVAWDAGEKYLTLVRIEPEVNGLEGVVYRLGMPLPELNAS